MIRKIIIKDNLSFKNVDIDIEHGLVVFTGLSGAGKSILFKSILATFALSESNAKYIEINLDDKINLIDFGIEEENENIFKLLKDKNTKYFINNQSINKKSLNMLSKSFIKYLSIKDNNEFDNARLLMLLDAIEINKNKDFKIFKDDFIDSYKEYLKINEKLQKIKEEEKQIEELKELATLHIQNIENINPKIEEYEELIKLKKKLSKKDKIQDAWQKANAIFDLEHIIIDALNLSEIDTSFFTECINELRIIAENQNLNELDNIDIEYVLDRLEKLSSLTHRYGSIENALNTLELKKIELKHYQNISFEKQELEEKVNISFKELKIKANKLSQTRTKNLKELENILNSYLSKLYIQELKLDLKENQISQLGQDEIILNINNTKLNNLSSGELNRLRLAFIASECLILNAGKGIIFLDEIDANLSGKEAMSIAKVLKELSKFYQIFAISHLPQLSSMANNHFLVEKHENISTIKYLNKEDRIKELARMISGEIITNEAMKFAKTLLNN